MNQLTKMIQDEISARGPISFARFMEIALYHPRLGYYEKPVSVIGRKGDFQTNVSVGPLYGALLGRRFSAWIADIGSRQPRLVEGGAHDGQLASDILGYFAAHQPRLYRQLAYWIIEPSPARRAIQKERLSAHRGVSWWASWQPIERFQGVVFANELLDSMPVHRFAWRRHKRQWYEWGVNYSGGRFGWQPTEIGNGDRSSQWLRERVPASLIEALPDGFEIEVCPSSIDWWNAASRRLDRGVMLAVDYGYRSADWFKRPRPNGTIRGYYRHRQIQDPLERPGDQDITAHVDFSCLIRTAEHRGLRGALMPQESFLSQIAAPLLRDPGSFPPWTSEQRRQFQTLIHPEHFGAAFSALIQSTDPAAMLPFEPYAVREPNPISS